MPNKILLIDVDSDINIALMRLSQYFKSLGNIVELKQLHITTDNDYKIVEVPVYPKKRVDINILKKYEDKYKLILANITSRIKDKAEAEAAKAESFVSQADVKAVISDKMILAMVIPEPKEPDHYDVTVVKR